MHVTSRRTSLRAAAAVTAGTVLSRKSVWGQTPSRGMITPDQAWDWHVLKSQCGPTYAGSSGKAVEQLVTDGTPVPVVASYGMTSGFTPPDGITARMVFYDPAHPPSESDIAGKILVWRARPSRSHGRCRP
jgi:hypothetical protein